MKKYLLIFILLSNTILFAQNKKDYQFLNDYLKYLKTEYQEDTEESYNFDSLFFF